VGFTGCVLKEDCFNMVSKFLAFKLVVVEEAPVDGVFNQCVSDASCVLTCLFLFLDRLRTRWSLRRVAW
jgi:hypothetical protein